MLMQQPGQFPLWMQAIGGNPPALRQLMRQPQQPAAPAAPPPAPPTPPAPGMSPDAQSQIDATRGALVGPGQGAPQGMPPGGAGSMNWAQLLQPLLMRQLQQSMQPPMPMAPPAPGPQPQQLGPFQNPLQSMVQRTLPQGLGGFSNMLFGG